MATTSYRDLNKAKKLHRDDVWAVDQPSVKNPVTERMGVSRGVTIDNLVKYLAEQPEIGGYINDLVLEEQERAEDADQALSLTLAEETARATTVEQQLASDITDEQGRAQQAEGTLQLHLDTEEARAKAAEQNLADQINQAKQQSTSNLATAITAEQNRAQQAENTVAAAITAEAVQARAAESNLGAAIQAEIDRTNAAIAGAISAEVSRANQAIETAVSEFHIAVEQETGRAIQSEESLDSAIIEERNLARQAEGELAGTISAERDRAQQAEEALNSAITAEAFRAKGIESSLQTAIENEQTRAQGAEQVNAADTVAEKVRAQAAEQLIRASVDEETTRAMAAEQINRTGIQAEEVRAREAEELLAQEIDTEENRAKAVEQSLSNTMVRKSFVESGEVVEDVWVYDSILERTVLKKRITKVDGSGYQDVSVPLPLADTSRAGSMSIEDKQAIEQHKELLLGTTGNIQEQLDKLIQLGTYYGAFDTYNQADETHTSLATDSGTPTPNDFAHIRVDETHEGAKTRYVWKDLGNGTYVWVFDVLIDQDDRNFSTNPLQEHEIADEAISDRKIGERTIETPDTDTPLESGTLTELLSNVSGRIEDKKKRLDAIEFSGNLELGNGKAVRIQDSEAHPHTIAEVRSETVQAPSDIPIGDTAIIDVAALDTETTGIVDVPSMLAGKQNVSALSLSGMITASPTTHIQFLYTDETDTDVVVFEQDGSGSFTLDLTVSTLTVSAKVTNTGAMADTIEFTGMNLSVTADTTVATAEIGSLVQHTDIRSQDRPTVNGEELMAYLSDIASEVQRAQTAEQANAQVIADEEQRAQAAEAEKLTRRMDYGNGIVEEYFLNEDGGGHKIEDSTDNSVSFSGFTGEVDNPVKHETSVKNKSNGIGTRLLQTLGKLFYTKNRADDVVTEDDEVQVKADVDVAVQTAKIYTDQVLAATAQATTYAGTIAKESDLPGTGTIHGQYYEVDDMDNTAPGKSGRAIWNGVTDPAQWDKRVDQQREADGETLEFRASDGALQVHDVEMSGVTADITDYGATVSGGFNAVLLSVFSKIRGLFSLMSGKANIASPTFTGTPKVPNKTGAATNDGTLLATEAQVYAKQDALTTGQLAAANSGITAALVTVFGEKQDALESGTNIKTINGASIFGPGNINVAASNFGGYRQAYLHVASGAQFTLPMNTAWGNNPRSGVLQIMASAEYASGYAKVFIACNSGTPNSYSAQILETWQSTTQSSDHLFEVVSATSGVLTFKVLNPDARYSQKIHVAWDAQSDWPLTKL
jgi:hypothetical protein